MSHFHTGHEGISFTQMYSGDLVMFSCVYLFHYAVNSYEEKTQLTQSFCPFKSVSITFPTVQPLVWCTLLTNVIQICLLILSQQM